MGARRSGCLNAAVRKGAIRMAIVLMLTSRLWKLSKRACCLENSSLCRLLRGIKFGVAAFGAHLQLPHVTVAELQLGGD